MKTLYLIRHGTVHNPDGILYRRLPGFLLSDHGRQEAEQTAAFLANEPIEIIWHSPLERARDTAEIVNLPHQAPLVEDERIHEWAEGEDSAEVLDRMWRFLQMWRESRYVVSAAVSHRDPIRRLLFAIEDAAQVAPMEDLSRFPLPQAGVYRIRQEPGDVLRAELVFQPAQIPEQ